MASSSPGLALAQSDNGATYGGYNGGLRASKASNFDGGLRVPAIARWPGRIPPGQVSTAVLASIDIFPTIVAAAGGELPSDRTIDGRDILPLLAGRASESPHEAIFALGAEELKMIRSGRWKLHVRAPEPGFPCLDDPNAYVDPRRPDGITIIAQFEQADRTQCPGVVTGPAPKPLMLFDMETDPAEQRDVAAEHPEIVTRLRAIFDRFDAEVPDEFQSGDRSPKILWIEGGELRYDRQIKPLPHD